MVMQLGEERNEVVHFHLEIDQCIARGFKSTLEPLYKVHEELACTIAINENLY